jgi:transposase
VDEVRRAQVSRARVRQVIKGKRWLFAQSVGAFECREAQQRTDLFALNRRVFKAYVLKESWGRVWTYRYDGAMVRYLQAWIDQLRWQRLPAFQKLGAMRLDQLDGILNHCRLPFASASSKPPMATSRR